MHLTKSVAYRRNAAMTLDDLLSGVALGGALAPGSWTGRRLLERIPEEGFALVVEGLLIISGLMLIAGAR